MANKNNILQRQTNLSQPRLSIDPSFFPYNFSTPVYCNNNELGTKEILHSWRQRRFGLPVVAATSNQRLRRDFSMESKFSVGGPIRHIIQVRTCKIAVPFGWLPQKLTDYRIGHSGLETSGSYLDMVNKSPSLLRGAF